jgi:hypothetical protein
MRTEGSDYVCGFTITGLPDNKAVTVSAVVDNEPRFLTGPWLGEGQPRPPRGSVRSILRGVQNLTLTKGNPSGIVTFEMTYAPDTSPPR